MARILCAPAVVLTLLLTSGFQRPRSEPRVLDPAMHHLGDDETPEWSEAPLAPEGTELAFEFQAAAGEATLAVTQRHVDNAWHLAINGTRVATLKAEPELGDHFYAVPAGVLVDGTNRLELKGDSPNDDITFGNVRLYAGSLRDLFALAPVELSVRDQDTGEPSPARVTILDAAGELAPIYFAERLHTAVRPGICYTADGSARIELAPGTYRVHASRGTEWSMAAAELVVPEPETLGSADARPSPPSAPAPLSVSLALRREVLTPGAIACDTHVHTLTFSGHGDSSVEERMVTLAGEGVELAIATDHNHNTHYRPYQERMRLQRWFTPVVGNEVTTPVGHFNGFPLDPNDPVPTHDLSDFSAIVSGIRARGAEVVILNHPRWPAHDTGPYGVAQLDRATGASTITHTYDAIEVINSDTDEPEPMTLFEDWFSLLNRGFRVCAVASSDSHAVGVVVGMGRTYVQSSTDDPAALDVGECCANIAAGRSTLSMGIVADATVGRASRPGSLATPPRAADGPWQLRLRVAAPSWVEPQLARVFVNGTELAQRPIEPASGQPTETTFAIELPRHAHDAWLVCVIEGAGAGGKWWPMRNDYTLAATNPIFLDGNADGRYDSPRRTAELLIERHGATPALFTAGDDAIDLQALDLLRGRGHSRVDPGLEAAAAGLSPRVRDYLDSWK